MQVLPEYRRMIEDPIARPTSRKVENNLVTAFKKVPVMLVAPPFVINNSSSII